MIEKLQHRYALSERGAKDLVQGVIACTVQNIAFMFPVSLLYFFVGDLLDGGIHGSSPTPAASTTALSMPFSSTMPFIYAYIMPYPYFILNSAWTLRRCWHGIWPRPAHPQHRPALVRS